MTYSLRPLKDPDHYHHDFEIDIEPGKPVALVRVLSTPEGECTAKEMALAKDALDALALLVSGRNSLSAWAKAERVLIEAGRLKPTIAHFASFPEMDGNDFAALLKRGGP